MLVPTCGLLRRRDAIEVIRAALLAKHAGQGHRTIAAALGVPASTVRGWLRRFTARAEELRVMATVRALRVDPMHPRIDPRGSPFSDALEALVPPPPAHLRRVHQHARSRWHVVATLMLGTQPLPAR